MSDPQNWMTRPLPSERSSGSAIRLGISVVWWWKWKTSNRGTASAKARALRGRFRRCARRSPPRSRSRLRSLPRTNRCSRRTHSSLSTPSRRMPPERLPGAPAMFSPWWRTRSGLSPPLGALTPGNARRSRRAGARLPGFADRVRGLEAALRQRLELVSHAVTGVDEIVLGRAPVDLLAQLQHEDIHGSVAVRRAPAPDALQELVARHHAPLLDGKGVEEPELRRRQVGAAPVDVRLHVVRVDPELGD